MLFKKSYFSLIELIVVIAILGILSSIVLISINNIKNKDDLTRIKGNIRNLQTATEVYKQEKGEYPTTKQPILFNQTISWDKIYPKYVKNKVNNKKELYYVSPEGEVLVTYGINENLLKWLTESDFIVENSDNPVYNGIKPPVGAVFLNYNKNTGRFENFAGKPRVLTLSVAVTGDTLVDLYNTMKEIDPENPKTKILENRMKLVGNFLKSKVFTSQLYGTTIYKVVPETIYDSNSKTWFDYKDESYTKDMALTAKTLIKISKATGDNSYAEEAKKILDTLVHTQNLVGSSDTFKPINGALPELYNTTGLYWTFFPLDIADMLFEAGYQGYDYFNDINYKNLSDNFIKFVEKSFKDFKGLSDKGYPYEYITYNEDALGNVYFEGKNQNQDIENGSPLNVNTWGRNQPFTTDQFFYISLGLMKANSPYGKSLFLKAKDLLNEDKYAFWGQYNPDGSQSSPYLEIVNTSFYLSMLKKYEPDSVDSFTKVLLNNMELGKDKNIVYGYSWAYGEDFIESLVSSFVIQKIIEPTSF